MIRMINIINIIMCWILLSVDFFLFCSVCWLCCSTWLLLFFETQTKERLLDVCVPNLQLLPLAMQNACKCYRKKNQQEKKTALLLFSGYIFFPPLFNSRCTFLCAYTHASCVLMTTFQNRRPNLLFFVVLSHFASRLFVMHIPYKALISKSSECIIWAFHWIHISSLSHSLREYNINMFVFNATVQYKNGFVCYALTINNLSYRKT